MGKKGAAGTDEASKSRIGKVFTVAKDAVDDGLKSMSLVKRRAFAQVLDKRIRAGDIGTHATVVVGIREGAPLERAAVLGALEHLRGANQNMQEDLKSMFAYLDSLNKWEFIRKAGVTGALQASEDARIVVYEAQRRVNKIDKLRGLLTKATVDDQGLLSDNALVLRVMRFHAAQASFLEDLGNFVGRTVDGVAAAIRHDATRAWVVENPDDGHKFLEASLLFTRQGINATARAGDALGNVPEQHAQAASTGIKWGTTASKAGMVVIETVLTELSIERQIASFAKDSDPGAIFEKHTEDPLLFAKELAKREEKELKNILDLAEPIVVLIADKVPGLDLAWEKARTVIEKAVAKYHARRLELANDAPSEGKDWHQWFVGQHKVLWENTKDILREDVTAVLNPAKLLLDVTFNSAMDNLMMVIMANLPIEPAQRVDGGQLRQIVLGVLNSVRERQQIVEGFGGVSCPSTLDDGRKVFALSTLQDADGDAYFFVRCDHVFGRLYMPDARFDPAERTDPAAENYRDVPTRDAAGRPLSEYRADHRRPHPKTGAPATVVRIGDVLGLLDDDTHTFTPTGADPNAYRPDLWKQRSLVVHGPQLGYRQLVQGKATGPVVEGKWYKAFEDQVVLIFEPVLGRREWVRPEWRTGDPDFTIDRALADVALTTYDKAL